MASLADLDRGVTVDDQPAAANQPSALPSSGRHRPLLELFPVEAEPRRAAPDRVLSPLPPSVSADTLTYETFYGFHEPPFALTSDPRFFYQSDAHDRAVQELLNAIRGRDGIALLTGDAGTGKTMACRMVIEELDRRTFTSVVEAPFTSIEGLLKTVLLDFGVVSRTEAAGGLADASASQLWDTLRGFLLTIAPLQASALVIIDEAQQLSMDMLDKVRLLADAGGNERLLEVVLVGQPPLRDMLARPELKDLAHRLTVKVIVRPLDPGEVGPYIAHRLAVAGSAPRVAFDDLAARRIHALSDGIPRAINLLGDRALAIAHAATSSVVDEAMVLAAARQLGVEPPLEPISKRRKAVIAALLLMLAGLGAAAAAALFRT
jgi:general secretion pathway protein A